MTQGILPFKYEEEKRGVGLTALGGLPLYLDLIHAMGLRDSIEKHMKIGANKKQGFTDSEVIISLMMLNLAGGESVEDMRILEEDEGFRCILEKMQNHGVPRSKRRRLKTRWRKERKRVTPSPASVHRYLSEFANTYKSRMGESKIPETSSNLRDLILINKDIIAFIQKQCEKKIATLDMDATLIETLKAEALYCYKGFKAYQPFNVFWAEHKLLLYSEFRDGNVSAGFQQDRVLKDALRLLPDSVETVRIRSDTAGYQHDFLAYCDDGKNSRFGRIEFAVGCPVTQAFKNAVLEIPKNGWKPLYESENKGKDGNGKEWAEVCFVPNKIANKKNGREYRYLVTREIIVEQGEFPGMEEEKEYPFPTTIMDGKNYKIFGIVTNMDWEGEKLIQWLYKRCGESEEIHRAMKEDFAGGRLPSSNLGVNAAWWWIMILSMNLHVAMKKLALGENWLTKKMKIIRFNLIHIPAHVYEKASALIIRCTRSVGWMMEIRKRLSLLKV